MEGEVGRGGRGYMEINGDGKKWNKIKKKEKPSKSLFDHKIGHFFHGRKYEKNTKKGKTTLEKIFMKRMIYS